MRRLRFLSRNEVLAVEDQRKHGQQREINGEICTLAFIPLSLWIPGELTSGQASIAAGLKMEQILGQKIEWADPEYDEDLSVAAETWGDDAQRVE